MLRSGDVDELRTVGAGLFSPHQLRYRGELARLSATPLGPAQLICMQYGGDAAVATTEPLDYYAVHLPLVGRSAVTFGRETVRPAPGAGVVFNPWDQPSMGWAPDVCQLAVRIPAAQVRAHVSMLTGRRADKSLRFVHGSTPGAGWTHALRTLVRVVDDHAASSLPHGMSQRLLEMFLTALVMTQPSSSAEALFADEVGAPHTRAVDRAADAVEAEPEADWTLARLASVAGVSGRSLEADFQRHRECSPMAFVRARRFELAHRRLTDPDQAHLSIAEIAHGSGFSHLGRFAGAYRARYGASPSQVRRSALG